MCPTVCPILLLWQHLNSKLSFSLHFWFLLVDSKCEEKLIVWSGQIILKKIRNLVSSTSVFWKFGRSFAFCLCCLHPAPIRTREETAIGDWLSANTKLAHSLERQVSIIGFWVRNNVSQQEVGILVALPFTHLTHSFLTLLFTTNEPNLRNKHGRSAGHCEQTVVCVQFSHLSFSSLLCSSLFCFNPNHLSQEPSIYLWPLSQLYLFVPNRRW